MEQSNSARKQILENLLKSKHGDLHSYKAAGMAAAKSDPDFFAHLMTWNLVKGEIRDTKIALPIIGLRGLDQSDGDLAENAVANLMSLDPRSLVRAYAFNKEMSKQGQVISGGHRRTLERALHRYLQKRESNRGLWDRVAIQHRKSLKELYAVSHMKPSDYAQQILFANDPPKGSVFWKIANLRNMTDQEAAGTILQHKIPFQIALGALGRKKEDLVKNKTFVLALLEQMSGQQLIASTKFLTSLGVMDDPVLKSEYAKAVERAKGDKKVSTLKAGKAIEALKDTDIDEEVIKNLVNIQEAKITQKGGIDGDWLVLGDKSGSMSRAVDTAREIAALIARNVTGKVHLIFFDTAPTIFDVTGKTLEEIKQMTKRVNANGGTSCGCGIKYLMDRDIEVNGIAIVTDGGDNSAPLFHNAYPAYAKKLGFDPTVYMFRVDGEPDKMSMYCQQAGIELDRYDLTRRDFDYYSLPGIVSQMKTIRYGIVDEIMGTELLTLDKVFA